MTPNKAKKLIEGKLAELNLPFSKLTARKVSFEDLARGSAIFVKIHGWKPSPLYDDLSKFARANDFRVETDHGM